MSRSTALMLAIVLPAFAGGCFPSPDYHDLADQSVIQRTVSVLETVTVADLATPSPQERAAIAAALARGGDAGLRVRVRLPQGVPVPAEADLRRRVEAAGIDPSIAVFEPGTGGAGTQLEFVRITLSAPDCADMVTPNESVQSYQRPSMAFGCATYSNLTRMLSDPADLASPRSFGGADGTTTASAVGRYHEDKVTPLRRTTSTRSLRNGN